MNLLSTIKRPGRSLSMFASAAAMLCAAGQALALPAVMDRVPETAVVTIAVPNFTTFKKDVESLGTLLKLPIGQGLDQFGLLKADAKGIKQDGSVAIIVFAAPTKKDDMGGEESGEPMPVVLVPITDYAAFLGNFAAKAGGGIDEIQIEGEPAFAKDLGGGFAALAKQKDHLALVDGKGGNLATHEKLAGKTGNALADRSDLFIAVNMPVARPLLKKSVGEGIQKMEENAPAMGAQQGDPVAMAKAMGTLSDEFLDSAQGWIAGLNIDNLGVALDTVLAFTDGSRFAKIAAEPGNAGALMGRLPGMPFLVAGALDLSSPALKTWFDEVAKLSLQAVPEEQRALNAAQFAVMQKSDGMAGIIGVSPAGLMGGLLANGVSFVSTKDPAALIKANQEAFKFMVDQKLASGKWEEGKQEIDGVKVDAFEYRLLPDPNNPGMAMGAGMIFGPSGGPAGFVARVDGGLIQTMGKNSSLVSTALKAAKGEGSFVGNKTVAQIGDLLPKGRAAEAYISVKDILNQVLPMAAMFGMPVTIDVPENLPPIGAAIAPGSGSVTASIYLPAPVLKTLAEVVKQFEAAQGGGGEPGEKPEGGQPQF